MLANRRSAMSFSYKNEYDEAVFLPTPADPAGPSETPTFKPCRVDTPGPSTTARLPPASRRPQHSALRALSRAGNGTRVRNDRAARTRHATKGPATAKQAAVPSAHAVPAGAAPAESPAAKPAGPSATLAVAPCGPQEFTSKPCSDHQPCIEPPVASHSARPSDPSCDRNSEGKPEMPTWGHMHQSGNVQHQQVHVYQSCDHPSYTSRLVSRSCKVSAHFSRSPAISASSSGKY